jgi:hypothetical protein
MDGVEYRVIITGELIEGCDVNEVVERLAALFKQPIDTMARLFGQRPIPINTPYPAAKAEKVQQHLHSIGALTRLEPVKPAGLSLQQPVGSGEAQASEEPEGFSCPKCGEAQTPSERCSHCGVIFAKLQGQTATSSEPHEARDERLDEALFIGNNSERYLEQFRKFRRSRRHDFAVTWHWPALLVPFYWATYRKMWGWSVVMLLSGVLWPFSSLLWAMTANHLYFGHMNKRLALVRNKCRGRSAEEVEERIMQAGGTSPIGLLVGIALSVFIGYHYVSSITAVLNEQVAEAQAAIAEDRMPQGVVKTPQGTSTFMNMTVLTIGLKLAAAEADSGLEPGMDIEAVGSKLQLPAQSLKDGWGRMMTLRIEHAGFTLASAGPDGEFETADDMVMYRDLE